MKTLLDVLTSGTDYLARQGCDEARAIMQHLMAHVLHCNRTYLYSHFDRPLTETELAPLRLLIKRKATGEPLQHLMGSTEFFKRDFLTDARALIPRPETEELVEHILDELKKEGTPPCHRILDMGTGSGIIGVTLAKELENQSVEVVLADISQAALSLALENAMRLGAKVATLQTDLFTAWQSSEHLNKFANPAPFDLIVANLPYIPNDEQLAREVNFDPSTALYGGPLGWEIIERFLTDAPSFLSEEGFVALEIGYDQALTVTKLMTQLGYRDTRVLSDLNGIARFPFGKKPLVPHSEQDINTPTP
ncbi:MAG: peptide chain release factor N(5)-glutamine methyltransferase [Akkermansia sp.]